MQFMYSFDARTRHGKPVTGLIDAASIDLAYHRIKKIGFINPDIKFNPFESLKSLVGADIDRRELSRFYGTVGQRMANGGGLLEALEGAQDYVLDERLKSAVAIMRAAVAEGSKPHEAMVAAGFNLREAMVVRALGEGGDQPQAFKDLSVDIKDSYELAQRLASMFRMFKYTLIGVYLFIPALFIFLAPKMMKFFKNVGSVNIHIPPSVQVFYDLVRWTQHEPVLAIAAYLAIPAGVIWFLRSQWARKLADKVKPARDLSIRSEHAQIWSSFALMYRAGIPPAEICEILARTVKRPESREGLVQFGKRLKAGESDAEAINSSGFPRFVISGYVAAKKSGGLVNSLLEFAGLLKADVELLTQRLSDYGEIGSKLLLAVVVMFVFYVVLYPMLGPVISSL